MIFLRIEILVTSSNSTRGRFINQSIFTNLINFELDFHFNPSGWSKMIFNLFSIFVKIAMRWPRTRDVCLPLRQTYKSRDVLF